MEFKLNNDLWRHNEVWQINRNHWLEIFRGGFWSHFFFQGGLCPPDFFSAYSTDQNEPLWRKKSAPLKKKKRPSEEKKAPPWKVSPLINLPLLLKNVTGTQCGGALANLDDQGWTWDYEYLLRSDDLWASPLVGLFLHRGHFAMGPSRSSPNYLQTLDACLSRTAMFFWMGGLAVDWRDESVLIIFQFFVNIIWTTKHSLFNSVPLHGIKSQKMTKELALIP